MDLDPRTPVIVAARRTPIGTAGHSLKDVTADALAAVAIETVVADLPDGLTVDEVVLGNCLGPGGNLARVAALRAGLPDETAARTVDLQCGSGLAAVVAAVDAIQAGRCDVVIAGGAESASTAPTRLWPSGAAYSRAPFAPAGHADPDMGPAADDLARHAGISRERSDRYAARSFSRARTAVQEGRFDEEIVPVGQVRRDERVRDGMTPERLARLRPTFGADGVVTAATATGISDGAAVVAVIPEELRARLGVPGLAVVATSQRGCDPALPGLGPVPAVRALLDGPSIISQLRGYGGGADWGMIDRVEINEAFAPQVLACCDALGLDEQRVCPDGGGLALGHPWGASGAVLLVRLFSALVRQGLGRTGLAAIAVGGGQGVAALVVTVGETAAS
ncbi:MAG: thiolase family protein [Intrasporangiaceae bacterium]|nr:thiolase family protein [Intrasporangiaceae bacterium]